MGNCECVIVEQQSQPSKNTINIIKLKLLNTSLSIKLTF